MEELQKQFAWILKKLQSDLGTIRTGRASTTLVDDLPVTVYDTSMKLKEVASVTIPEPRQLLISPWDPSNLKEVEKALRVSGFNPTVGSDALRIVLPPLTGEEREKLIREVNEKTEEAKVETRKARREAVSQVEEQERTKQISKDDSFAQKKKIDGLLDSYNRRIDEILQERKSQFSMN